MAIRSASSGTTDVPGSALTATTWFGRKPRVVSARSARVAGSAGSPTIATSTTGASARSIADSHWANPVG